jgi:hypothetical protein
MLRFIRWIASKLPRRDICAEDGAVYMERYRVFGWMPGSKWRGPSLYLHRFRLPDQDLALHNHPWPLALSLILTGCYLEETDREHPGGSPRRHRGPGSLRLLTSRTYHRVDALIGETWTLFLVAPKSRSWGFWLPGRGHIEWRQRLAERGITPEY